MPDVRLIGDELHYEGYLVAILVATGVPASVMGAFESGVGNADLFDGIECDSCDGKVGLIHDKDCKHYEHPKGCGGPAPGEEESEYDCAMDDLLRSMKPFAKGGLIKYADLERIAAQLKEEKEVEATTSG